MEYQTTRNTDMQWLNWIGGMAVGALAMYIADPSEGRRRRALLQDKMTHYSHQTQKMVGSTVRDARNRLTGLQSEASRMMSSRQAKPLDNHVLEARVRSRIARAMPEFDEIEVTADDGIITLSGDIHADYEDQLIELVEGIPGVEGVNHGMQSYVEEARGMLSSMFAGRSPLWMAGAIGAGLLTWYGLTRRQPLGLVAAATSLGLMARGGSGMHDMAEGMQGSQEGFAAECSIDIQASPEVVYDVWSRYENFPHFMSHVIEVRDLGQGRSHWVVQGPGGSEVEFDSQLTSSDRPHRLAWQSEQGATVENEGVVTLQPEGSGTRATVRMAWRPPAGAVGKGVAVLMGADPQTALEDDLRRMKQFIERGLPGREGGAAKGSGNVLH